jgi:uncharacterized MnhB-related membrane protein
LQVDRLQTLQFLPIDLLLFTLLRFPAVPLIIQRDFLNHVIIHAAIVLHVHAFLELRLADVVLLVSIGIFPHGLRLLWVISYVNNECLLNLL